MTHLELRLFYVPCPSRVVALDLGKRAVELQLAACANILTEHISVYVWEGKLVEEPETLLLLKTTQARTQELAAFLTREHPYEVPCVLQLPIADLNAPYRAWLVAQTGG